MTIIEDLKEPLILGELNPPAISASVFTAAESYTAFAKPLSNGRGDNPVSHDLEEEGTSRWVWAEVYEQLWLAGPIMGMYFLQSIMAVAVTVFVGHLGSLPLAAFTLANAFVNMTGFTILAGMASALETLCGQAYGAKQYHLLGIYVQRAVFILAVACVPIGVVWVNVGRILVALGEDPVVAQYAQSFSYWSLPNLVEYAVMFPLIKFFQTQGAVFQLMLATAVTTVLFHVPLCWLIIDRLHVGLNGAANVWTIAIAVNLCLLLGFVRFSPRFQKTSSSLSRDAFQDFGEFFSLAIPSATMVCLEAWSHEALALLAGLLPNSRLNLSTFAICMGLLALCNMVSLALGVATSVRVSNELGAGKAHVARSVLAVSMVVGVVNGAVLAGVIYWFRDIWGWAFTNDVEVVLHVANTAPYLAALTLLYAIGSILSGVVRGIGWQRVGAIANLGAYYVVGLPVAVISVFVFKFDAKGLWLGMGCGLVTQITILISIIFCANWNQLAQEALLRSHSLCSRLPTLATSILEPFQEDKRSLEEFKKLSIGT